MKKIISFLLSLALLCSAVIVAEAANGENFVLFSATQVDIPKNPHISGDSNGDRKVNVLDVVATLKYISGNKSGTLRDSIDTNFDGTVNVVDAMLIIRHILGENVGLGELVG